MLLDDGCSSLNVIICALQMRQPIAEAADGEWRLVDRRRERSGVGICLGGALMRGRDAGGRQDGGHSVLKRGLACERVAYNKCTAAPSAKRDCPCLSCASRSSLTTAVGGFSGPETAPPPAPPSTSRPRSP